MKKLVLAVAAVAIIAAMYMASNNGGIESLTTGGTSDLAVECGWSDSALSDSEGSIGVVITNNSGKAATNVNVSIKACDADGKVIGYKEDDPDVLNGYASGSAMNRYTINCIMPGEKAAVVGFGFGLAEPADHIEVSIDHVTWKDTEKVGERLVLEDYSYDPWDQMVTLTIRNDTEYDYGDLLSQHNIDLYMIARDGDGAITGGVNLSIGQYYWDGEVSGNVVRAGETTVVSEYVDPNRLGSAGAAVYEVYIDTYDIDGNDMTYYVDDTEYTEEEYIQYLKDQGVWDE